MKYLQIRPDEINRYLSLAFHYHQTVEISYHPPVRYTCDQCGFCCSKTYLDMTDLEVKELCEKGLGWSLEVLGDKVKKVDFKRNHLTCVHYDFFKHECTIYKDRPSTCRNYPFQIRRTGLNRFMLGINRRMCDDECFREGRELPLEELKEIIITILVWYHRHHLGAEELEKYE